ncbi:MAG: MobC family plasmid mobilization relaxosome protein [Hyphomicrobiaceae bacterium]
MSGLCERLVLEGKVDMATRPSYRAMDPALFTELRRIGNNINQVAHATNSNLPTDVMFAFRSVNQLLTALLGDELLSQKLHALKAKAGSDGPPASQARDVFQRSVRVHSARSKDDFP